MHKSPTGHKDLDFAHPMEALHGPPSAHVGSMPELVDGMLGGLQGAGAAFGLQHTTTLGPDDSVEPVRSEISLPQASRQELHPSNSFAFRDMPMKTSDYGKKRAPRPVSPGQLRGSSEKRSVAPSAASVLNNGAPATTPSSYSGSSETVSYTHLTLPTKA